MQLAGGTPYSKGYGEPDSELIVSQDNVTIIGEAGSGPIIDGTGAAELWTKGIEIRGSNVAIHNLYITNFDYGIKIDACSPEISRNAIYDNNFNLAITAGSGQTASPVIKNNLIYETVTEPLTVAVYYGIYVVGYAGSTVIPEIYHNTIDGGEYEGILIQVATDAPIIKYNIITNFRQYGIQKVIGTGSPIIDYNDVWNNGSSAADNYKDCLAGAHDISADPKYGSYTLQPTSPCINAIPTDSGDLVDIDIDNNPRPYGSGFDMGCYENTTLPAVTTTAISGITSTTATSGGNVTSEGSSSVTARGVCWSTSQNPTVDLATKTVNGSGIGVFTSSITGLSPSTTYYVRAYATNSTGTGYGGQVSFTTSAAASVPAVTTTAVSGITSNTATSGGNVTSEGSSTVTARGVCWSTSQNPTVDLATKTVNGSGIGVFTSSITGLSPSTTYYVRAYATNSAGTGYGGQVSFTTVAAPTVSFFSPPSGGAGTPVTITGTNFTNATAVKFGGTNAASFIVDSPTQITALVGAGSTGKVTVTTEGGTATSEQDFIFYGTYNYCLPGGTGQVSDYRLFTVPLDIGTGANLLQAMENVLGTYDPTHWRVFRLQNSSYLEINSPDFALLPMIPGIGLWIITLYTNTVPFEGALAPQTTDYAIVLEPGWHMIALPWPSADINLGSVTVSDGTNTYAITDSGNTLTQQSVWDYTGSGPYEGYEKRPTFPETDYMLQPGVGYFLKVLSASNVTVTFPPAIGASAPAPGTKNAATTGLRSTSRDNEEPPPGFPCKVTERAFTASPGLSLLPLPPDGLYDLPDDCPDCTGSDINREVKNVSFRAGPPCQCTATESITIGPGVTIEEGADVTFKAPRVNVLSGFSTKPGAVVKIKQE